LSCALSHLRIFARELRLALLRLAQHLDQRRGGAEEAAITARGADELHAERKGALAREQRQRQGPQAGQSPQGAEHGIAVALRPFGAMPGAAGVKIASYSSKISVRLAA
jgi:hypothetical protein